MITERDKTISIIGNEIKLKANNLFNLEEIQQMQDLFSNATGVASLITYPNGIPITKPSNFCRLCNDIIRKTEKGCSNCFISDAAIGRHNLTGPVLQPCLSGGLWDAGVSITIGDEHIANWLIGQVRTPDMDEQRMVEYAAEIGVDKKEFLEALRDVPIMSVDQFKKISDMLFVYANGFSEKIYKSIQLEQQIAEREKITQALLKSEEALSITLHSIGDGVISTDKKGLIVSLNPVAENLCGWKLSEARGKSLTQVFNIINAESRRKVDNPVDKVLESGKIIGLANHTVLISRDGSEYHISDSAAPIKNSAGEISGVVLIFSDVTDQYRAEANLIESERSKSVLLANLPGTAYRCKFDRTWTKEFISKGCVELTGYQVSDFINNNTISFDQLILPEYRDYLWKIWENAARNKEIVRVEYKICTADNQIKWVWEQGVPILNKDGEVEAIEGIILDISERKQIEEALKQSEEKYRHIIENIQDVFYQVNMDGNLFEISPSIKQFAEYEPDEIIGSPIERLYACAADCQTAYVNLLRSTQLDDYEVELITKSGDIRHASLNARLFLDSNGNPDHIDGFIRDVTHRKQIESALKSSQEQLKKFASHLQSVREEERILLAREIHDELGQILIAIKIDLGMLKQKILKSIKKTEAENILTIFDNVFGLVDNTIKTTRKIMTDLRPEVLYLLGFIEAVKLHVTKFQERYHINCKFKNSVKNLELNTQQSVALFRILQESLTNVARHSKADSLKVSLSRKEDKLIFQICDSGIGMSENSKSKQDSYGLIGMRERVFLLDGELSIISQLGKGTTIKVEMPYAGTKEEN